MNLLNLQDEKLKTVKVKGHKFVIRFISPMDRVKISQQRMNLQNGNPLSSLTDDEFINFENIAMIDTCTEEMPDGFNQNESCLKWEDQDLINKLAHEIRGHTADLESKLKKNKHIEGGE